MVATTHRLAVVDTGLLLDCAAIIVAAPTGVVYEHQAGGTRSAHPRVEGFLVPLADETGAQSVALARHFSEAPYLGTGFAEIEVDGRRGRGVTVSTADWLEQSVLPRWARVDRARLHESGEAWVRLKVRNDPNQVSPGITLDTPRDGVLVWLNSD
jgi:hypothetical protein